jgi:hypothetical protein
MRRKHWFLNVGVPAKPFNSQAHVFQALNGRCGPGKFRRMSVANLTKAAKALTIVHKRCCKIRTLWATRLYEVTIIAPVTLTIENFAGARMEKYTMKKIALAAALSIAATSAFAGGMAEPVMEAPMVEAKAASSSAGGIIVPLLVLLLVAAAASN